MIKACLGKGCRCRVENAGKRFASLGISFIIELMCEEMKIRESGGRKD
jgi:hypothetical protein